MKWATLGQAKKLLSLFDDVPAEQVQALLESGLLANLRDANIAEVDHSEYQRVLGLNSVFRVRMGGLGMTDQIVANLGFPANDHITQENFPIPSCTVVEEVEIEIVDSERGFSETEGLAILEGRKLARPTYEHALRFAEQHGKTTTSEKKPFVIFLHKAWRGPDHRRRVMCLDRDPRGRKLNLECPEYGFYSHYMLAGVRPRKQGSRMDRRRYDEPQPCPYCGCVEVDPAITAEMMEAASRPYGYMKCPKHFPDDRE